MPPPLRLERRGGSATVVITLTAEAAERGLEYAEVLAKAKTIKKGALEIPGVNTGPKGGALAATLRDSLEAAEVRDP